MLAIMSYLYAEVRLFKFLTSMCSQAGGWALAQSFLCIAQSIGFEKNMDGN